MITYLITKHSFFGKILTFWKRIQIYKSSLFKWYDIFHLFDSILIEYQFLLFKYRDGYLPKMYWNIICLINFAFLVLFNIIHLKILLKIMFFQNNLFL